MKKERLEKLSRRERQIMDIIFRLGHATAYDVMENMSDAPSYSTVRTWLSTMEDRGLLKHGKSGKQYVYSARIPFDHARQSAIEHLVDTFFKGSRAHAVSALLGEDEESLSDEELEEIIELIRKSREEGR